MTYFGHCLLKPLTLADQNFAQRETYDHDINIYYTDIEVLLYKLILFLWTITSLLDISADDWAVTMFEVYFFSTVNY